MSGLQPFSAYPHSNHSLSLLKKFALAAARLPEDAQLDYVSRAVPSV